MMGRQAKGQQVKMFYPSIKEVIRRDDYTLFLVFENGRKGVST
jgi:hypothetical protein